MKSGIFSEKGYYQELYFFLLSFENVCSFYHSQNHESRHKHGLNQIHIENYGLIIQNCVICFGNLEINSNSHKGYTYNNQLYILNSALIFLDSSIFTYICNFLWPINEFISYFIISAYILKKMYRYIHLSPSLTQLGKFVILQKV